MSNASLREAIGRDLLIAPPSWGRVARFAATAWLMAVGGLWAAQQLHQGSHEAVELGPVVHLLRDASLAVPMAAIAIALGGLLTVDALRTARAAPAGVAGRVTFAVVAALIFAILSIPGQQVHSLAFGAEAETGDWVVDILDSVAVLVAALVVLLPAALMRLAPWPPDTGAHETDRLVRQDAGPPSHVSAFERLGEQGVSRDA
jgi:hypothetical protein